MRRSSRKHRGFTLIEILIVVVILGILAAIVIPQFTNASQEATASSIRSQLQTLRGQIELFRVRNGGDLPADFDDLLAPPAGQALTKAEIPAAPCHSPGARVPSIVGAVRIFGQRRRGMSAGFVSAARAARAHSDSRSSSPPGRKWRGIHMVARPFAHGV